MATLLLTAAGAALGGLFGPVGAIVGRAAGALAGGVLDRMFFGGGGTREIGRLADLEVQSSTEGAAIPRVFGRVRIAGEVIWATRFEEEGRSESAGGKGGGPKLVRFSYFANLAVGICEGPVARIGRVWANGRLLDLDRVTMRVHPGDETQQPDSLILARQGADAAPAYRGLCYAVFERLPLEAFGNALPQLTFEVIRPVGDLERTIRAVTLIPGATEFGYATTEIQRVPREGATETENRHATTAATDVDAALDELQAVCPNLEAVALVVAWFGDDLRCGECTLRPKVERADKTTRGAEWSVAGLTRAAAGVVSSSGGAPAYGGTPSDDTVVALIRAIKARGLALTLYPFVMMDVPAGNGLPDPGGSAEQPAYPWRGRITCNPAPGRPGTPDKTAAAAPQVDAFVGTAAPSHFSLAGDTVVYAGPAEWTLRRMVLHMAKLCEAAGGVDSFLIASEMPGLSRVRRDNRRYPFVEALTALAADVRSMLGPATRLSYAADWTEYFGHHPADGSGDVTFHLDPLWAHPAIDFVGIDAYWPLTDWRDGDHLDRPLATGPLDRSRLAAAMTGGEGFDWYYASDADRRAQLRTPITDGLGKPWIFRFKDVGGWWGNRHHDRVAGVEQPAPTAWLAGMKPIRFTEIGCPAVDRGPNQPNVFPDRRSSEGADPWFSHGTRDDAAQRIYLETFLEHFRPAPGGTAANPLSPLDGRAMVEWDRSHVWTFDARPHPWFPLAADVWADGTNWTTGHWLNGRLGAAPLAGVARELLAAAPEVPLDAAGLTAVVDGLAVPEPSSPRAVLERLSEVFGFTVAETAEGLAMRDRPTRPDLAISGDDLVEDPRGPTVETRRVEAADLSTDLTLGFLDSEADGQPSTVAARRAGPRRGEAIGLPVSASAAVMRGRADALLADLEAGREQVAFALAPTALAPEAGDVVTLTQGGGTRSLLVQRIEDGPVRRVSARTIDLDIAARADRAPPRRRRVPAAAVVGPPVAVLLDLPSNGAEADAHRPWIAATCRPWPGPLAVSRAVGGGFAPLVTLDRPAVMGRLDGVLPAGPCWLIDRGTTVEVTLVAGTLASVTEQGLLDGANLAAVGSPATGWEVLQFRDALLIGERRYRLGGFLRGQGGTETRAALGAPAGTRFVLLDRALARLPLTLDDLDRPLQLRVGPADRDVGDPAVAELTETPAGVGLAPYAPVRARLTAGPFGDLQITWTRRTRVGGDGFDAYEVPLGETSERYEVDIMSGGLPLRTLASVVPSVDYAYAEQVADFGAPATSLDVAIVQISNSRGRGTLLRTTLHV